MEDKTNTKFIGENIDQRGMYCKSYVTHTDSGNLNLAKVTQVENFTVGKVDAATSPQEPGKVLYHSLTRQRLLNRVEKVQVL